MFVVVLCIHNKDEFQNKRIKVSQGGGYQSLNEQWMQWIQNHQLCYIDAQQYSAISDVLIKAKNIFGGWWQYKHLHFQKYQLGQVPSQQAFEQSIKTYIQLQSIEYDKTNVLRLMGYSIINNSGRYQGLIYVEGVKNLAIIKGDSDKLLQQLVERNYKSDDIAEHLNQSTNWVITAQNQNKLANFNFKIELNEQKSDLTAKIQDAIKDKLDQYLEGDNNKLSEQIGNALRDKLKQYQNNTQSDEDIKPNSLVEAISAAMRDKLKQQTNGTNNGDKDNDGKKLIQTVEEAIKKKLNQQADGDKDKDGKKLMQTIEEAIKKKLNQQASSINNGNEDKDGKKLMQTIEEAIKKKLNQQASSINNGNEDKDGKKLMQTIEEAIKKKLNQQADGTEDKDGSKMMQTIEEAIKKRLNQQADGINNGNEDKDGKKLIQTVEEAIKKKLNQQADGDNGLLQKIKEAIKEKLKGQIDNDDTANDLIQKISDAISGKLQQYTINNLLVDNSVIVPLQDISQLQLMSQIPSAMKYKKYRQFKDPYLAFAYSYLELIIIKGEHNMDYLQRSIHNGRCSMFQLCNIFPSVTDIKFPTIRKTIKSLLTVKNKQEQNNLINLLHDSHYFGTFSKQVIKQFITHLQDITKQLTFTEKITAFSQSVNNQYTAELLSYIGRCMYIRAIELTDKRTPRVKRHFYLDDSIKLEILHYPPRREISDQQLTNSCESAIASMMGTNICSIYNFLGQQLAHTYEPVHDQPLSNINQSVSMIIQGSDVITLYSARNYLPYGSVI